MNFKRIFLTDRFFAGSLLLLAAVTAACQPKVVMSEESTSLPTPTPAATTAKPSQSITIAAVGDIMMGSTSINDTFLPPNDGRDMFKDAAPILQAADIAFGNLEGPLVEGGVSTKCGEPKPGQPIRCFAFRSPTRYGRHLKDAGFDILSLANNHAGDFGDLGRNSTRRTLDALDIKHAGSDRGANSTTVVEAAGTKVAFIAFAHNSIVPNVNDLVAARRYVLEARKKAEIVVVSFHGGAEGESAQNVPNTTEMFVGEKRGDLRRFARTVIDAGADLVLGHGPHVLRGMEVYKDRLVVYSMGNFATYGMFNLKGPQGITAVFEISIDESGKFLGGKITPFRLEGRGIPVRDENGTASTKIRSLSAADFGASAPVISDDGSIAPRR